MASGRSPWGRRVMQRWFPWLFRKCMAGNYHMRWERLCYCRRMEFGGDPAWHGGIEDMKTGEELVPLRTVINPRTNVSMTIPDTYQPYEGWRWL